VTTFSQFGKAQAVQGLPQSYLLNSANGISSSGPLGGFYQYAQQPAVAGSDSFQAPKTASTSNAVVESPAEQQKMYEVLKHHLKSHSARKQLEALKKHGVLQDCNTDDGHSALFHLYSIISTPRQPGYRGDEILRETVEIISKPYVITQHFGPLSDKSAEKEIFLRNHPEQDPFAKNTAQDPSARPLTAKDLNVDNSATCVSSSVMYVMAQKEPAELARQISQLTGPMNGFYEKATFSEISPDDPSQAAGILKQSGVQYKQIDNDRIMVKVNATSSAIVRAIDAQKAATGHKDRNAVETIYQSALTHLATSTYDAATDLRGESDNPLQTSKGLSEQEKSLMETIVEENGGVQSVTYQAVGGKAHPDPGHSDDSYLYGYNRNFQQTARDLVTALQNNRFVIVGLTETDKSGAIVGGHEITLTKAFTDKKTGELKFIVADSDDDNPQLVARSARELIPRIHHAGFSIPQAQAIKKEMEKELPGSSYLVPDRGDAQSFNLLETCRDPQQAQEENSNTQAAQAAKPAAFAGKKLKSNVIDNPFKKQSQFSA